MKLAECMAQRGIKTAPIFWIATEDHDFAEVATAEFINRDCTFSSVQIPEEIHSEGLPVGRVTLDQSIELTLQTVLSSLPKTEFTDDLEKLLRDCYAPGKKFGDAFAQMMIALVGENGFDSRRSARCGIKEAWRRHCMPRRRGTLTRLPRQLWLAAANLRTPVIMRRSRLRRTLFRCSCMTKTARAGL